VKFTNYETPHYAIFSSVIGPIIHLSTVFSDTFSLCSWIDNESMWLAIQCLICRDRV